MPGLAMALAAVTLAATPLPSLDQEVHIGQGEQALYGALIPPDPKHPAPALLLLPGSGPEDRNGDDLKAGQRAQTLKLLAEGLAGQGFASLRIDKRGVGASAPAAPRPQDLRIGAFVDDAAAWARFLRAQPGVRCVIILGHSEGALIAALAAQKVQVCGVVSASGSARDLGALIESQNALARRSPALIARTHEIILSLRAGKAATDVPPELDGVFGPGAQAYTMSLINIDPVAELARVEAPVLVLQGASDLQVSVDDAKALAGRPDVKLIVVTGMTHVLKIAPTADMAGNFRTYLDPALPLAPDVVPLIAGFASEAR